LHCGAHQSYEKLLEFKEKREEILHYLEPQYKRICATATDLSEYIKKEKKGSGILCQNQRCNPLKLFFIDHERVGQVIVLLKNYADALMKRDMPVEIRAKIKG